MTAAEIRSTSEAMRDLINRSPREDCVYERATVGALYEIAAQIAEVNEREKARLWTPPTQAEGVYTAQILDILGAPSAENGNSLNIQERVAWLLNKRDGVKV